jgi:hypothetical protein
VKYPKFPPIGLRSAKGLFGLAVHLAIFLGAVLAPEYFLFPLGLFYVTFGVVRATVLGLMERQEQTVTLDEQLAEPSESPEPAAPAPTAMERRAGWVDRRQQPEDR